MPGDTQRIGAPADAAPASATHARVAASFAFFPAAPATVPRLRLHAAVALIVSALLIPVIVPSAAAEVESNREVRLAFVVAAPDLDRDGVPDLVFIDKRSRSGSAYALGAEIRAVSGATSATLWERPFMEGGMWNVRFLAAPGGADVLLERHVLERTGSWESYYVVREEVTIMRLDGVTGEEAWRYHAEGEGLEWGELWHDMPFAPGNRIASMGFPVQAWPAGLATGAREDVLLSVSDVEGGGTGYTRLSRLDGESGEVVWTHVAPAPPGGRPPRVLEVGDLTRDGAPDWLVAGITGALPGLPALGTLKVVAGRTGAVAFETVVPLQGAPRFMDALPLEGSPPRFLVRAEGSTTLAAVDARGEASWARERANVVHVLAAGDTNSDGISEIHVLSREGGTAVIELLDGRTGNVRSRATFPSPLPFAEVVYASGVSLGDVTSNGVRDLLLIHSAHAVFTGERAVVVRALEGARFDTLWTLEGSDIAAAMSLGDVTGDGFGNVLAVTLRVDGDDLVTQWSLLHGATGDVVWTNERRYARTTSGGTDMYDRWVVVATAGDLDEDGSREVLFNLHYVEYAWGNRSWYVVGSESVTEAWNGGDGSTMREWTHAWDPGAALE